LWLSGTRAKPGPDEGGFYCWDTTTDAPCPLAWFPVAPLPQQGNPFAPVSHSPFSGVARFGNRIYGAAVHLPTGQQANRINVECLDTTTLTTCGSVNLNTVGLPGWDPNQFPAGRSPTLSMEVIGSRFYFVVDYGSNPSLFQSRGNRLFCFDMATGAACTGWTVPVDVLPATTIATIPPAQVEGETETRTPTAPLPVTGANLTRMVILGLLALASGAMPLRSREKD